MRFFGHHLFCKLPAFQLGFLFLLSAGLLSPAFGQTAPYVIPYTMSTYAGPNAPYTPGQACFNSTTGVTSTTRVALDAQGDGCLAPELEIGADPHDIRVDGQGNVFWIDDGSEALLHKINGETQQQTVYVGSTVNSKPCSVTPTPPAIDTAGDGCHANDGAANNNPAVLTTSTKFKAQRGLGLAPNGDLYSAGYNDYNVHKVSASTGIFSLAAGTGASASVTSAVNGPVATTELYSPRGVGADAAGNIYIADTSLNVVQEVEGSNLVALTAANSTKAISTASGVSASMATVAAPEDVKVDSYGNIFIADPSDQLVRAIYVAGTLPGFPNPASLVPGDIYTIAGNGSQPPYTTSCYSSAPTAPPPIGTYNSALTLTDGISSTVPATSVALQVRKLSIDARGNLYLADSCNGVVWFVDATTGSMRVLAGLYGQTQSPTPSTSLLCSTYIDSIGDGCPGPQSSLDPNADMGVSFDNQGNLYITDAEGGGGSISRLRKLLSGLNFPAVAMNSSRTQTVQIHFAPGDSFSTAAIVKSDFSAAATPTCTVEADTTSDCLFQITFTPTVPGNDTALFTIKSTLGGVNSYLLTGTGTAGALAIDPGSLSLFNSTAKNAQGVTVDGAGNVYIADTGNNRVLKYTLATAATSIFAGSSTGTSGYSGDGGLATAATLNAPRAVAIDTSGNVYIADSGNNVVRRVSASGVISTFAGGVTTVCSTASDALGDNCPATQATLSAPSGLATDNLGQVYISDTGNNLIRQVSLHGYITTLAGGGDAGCTTATDTQNDGCAALQATLSAPAGLAYDSAGNNLFLADSGHSIIRKFYLGSTFTPVGSSTSVVTAVANLATLVAGNGQAGDSTDSGGSAILSQLNKPQGVALDAAGNVYIADTLNDSLRLVSSATGAISTIVGINGSAGDSTPGSAADTELTSPASLAIFPGGTLYVADSGNNRVLTDDRTQVAYNFGRTNLGAMSPVESFSELNIGTVAASLPQAPPFTASGNTTQFTLTTPSGSAACPTSIAVGASCILNGQFIPTTTGNFSATYTEAGASSTPSITFTGVGAVLTTTTGAVAQTAPTGSAQYGASLTLTATITPSSCNTAAPSCYPTGTVRIVVDGVAGSQIPLDATGSGSQAFSGLSVGPHTVSCNYSGDDFYAASSCPAVTITVAAASTTSVLTATNNNQPQFPGTGCVVLSAASQYPGDTQCTATTLNATVASNTTGSPTGTVTFSATGGPLGTKSVVLGTASLNPTTGVASYPLTYIYTPSQVGVVDSTLAPGTYTLTCTYAPATSNYAASNCAPLTFVVLPQPVGFTLAANGILDQTINGVPAVFTAQGATTDVYVSIIANNTVSGPVTISCSGLPAASDCTFSPSNLVLSAGTVFPTPQTIDVTIFNDLQPGTYTSSLRTPSIGPGPGGSRLALLLGWPLALLGLAGFLRLRRKPRVARGLSLLVLLIMMTGSALIFTGCTGPGAYQPVLTPAGTYPITITVTVAGVTHTIVVDYLVAAPGIPGQE